MDALLASTNADIADFLAPPRVREYGDPPSALVFLKECVAPHQPCVVKNGFLTSDSWHACVAKWDLSYFETDPALAEKIVKVNATPDGLADAVKSSGNDRVFTTPCEVQMKMGDFVRSLGRGKAEGDAVLYLSEQNDNLRSHFADSLMRDIPQDIPLAREVFGAESGGGDGETFASGSLTAVNLWIGDERSVSSLHKDFYENFYFVVKGCKVFDLLPPAAVLNMRYQRFPCKQYTLGSSSSSGGGEVPRARDLTLIDCGDDVEWLDEGGGDPASPALRVHLREGQMLYVPAMWLHRVTQVEPTIAVNYWFEQAFDHRYVLYNLCRRLGELRAVEE